MTTNYKILKVLNNNSLLITDGDSESIIIGKGIGFKRSADELLDDSVLVEKKYHLITDDDYKVSSAMPKKIIQNTAIIVEIINASVDGDISGNSFLSLTNHIAAMLVRVENDEIFLNPFHHETVTLYGDSYKISLAVANEIKEKTGVDLPDAEIDFLTLYIHSIVSSYDNQNTTLRNAIISDVSDTIEDTLKFDLDKSSAFYARFVTHLKFLIERLSRDEPIVSIPMVHSIADQFPQYMEMSKVIADVIEKHLDSKLSIDEHTFIALHLARLTMYDKVESEKTDKK